MPSFSSLLLRRSERRGAWLRLFCWILFLLCSSLASSPALAQSDRNLCGKDWDCADYVVYPPYYGVSADHCSQGGPPPPPALPPNLVRWYLGATNGFKSEHEAAEYGYEWEKCWKTVDDHRIICSDLGVEAISDWIVSLYWEVPTIVASAWRAYHWIFTGKTAPQQDCSAPFPLRFDVTVVNGWGCPEGPWMGTYDSAGKRFCYRERHLPNPPKAPPGCFGNPINCVYGSKRETEADYRGPTLDFVRHYDSSRTAPIFPATTSTTPIRLGKGWRSKYDRRVDTSVVGAVTTIALTREGDDPRYFKMSGGVITSTPEEQGQLRRNGSGWRYVASDDSTEDYDAGGRLLVITGRNGSTETLFYDAQGMLLSVTDTFGRQLTFSYDESGHIHTLIDPRGGLYVYAYDEHDNLVSVTYPDQTVRRYTYNEADLTASAALFNALTGIADENGTRFASFGYAASGEAVRTMHHASPSRVVNQYSVDFTSTTRRMVTDPRGTVRAISVETASGASRIIGMSNACPACASGTIAAASYDANNNVSSHTDFNGNKTCFLYNLARNLETVRVEGLRSNENCATALAAPPNRPDVRKIETTWSPTFRLPVTLKEPAAGGSRATTFSYDDTGNLTQKIVVAPKNDGSGGTITLTWSWTYTTFGRVLTATDPNGNMTVTTYHPSTDNDAGRRGNVATTTNPLGHVTGITAYDADGRPTTTIDPNGLTTTLIYDTRGRLLSRDVGGEVTTYAYDGVGQLTKATQPDGSYLIYTYDGAHRLTEIADGLGNRIVYTLDAIGNRTEEQVFDPFGNLARTRSRAYDALNRLAHDMGAAGQTRSYDYDMNGNLTSAIDPLNHATGKSYDALNRLTQMLDPAGAATGYGHNPAGNLISVTDPRGLTTSYMHDGVGRVITQVSPDTGTTINSYDPVGNLAARTDARGVSTAYSYDALNRVTQAVYDKVGANSETHTFEYDGGSAGQPNAKGHLTKLSDGTTTTTWSYTLHGRVQTKTQTIGGRTQTLRYGYNAAGQLAELSMMPSGYTVRYGYLNNRVVSIDLTYANPYGAPSTGPLLSGVVTTPFGPIGAWGWANGTYTFRNFDTDGRLTSWEFRNGVSILRNELTYDAAGRVVNLIDPAQSALAQSYDYDALDRLVSVKSDTPVAHSQQFSYDAVGNRTSSTTDGIATTLSYAVDSNRLSRVQGATATNYIYDGTGNPTTIGVRSFNYNLTNRLTAVTDAGGTVATYTVNPLGQRVAKTVGSATTRFVYDEQGRLMAEYNASGYMLQQIVWLEDLPVAVLFLSPVANPNSPMPITAAYVHADHLATPRAVTWPSDNSIVWRWDNVDPFGANAANEAVGPWTLRFGLRFPGQYYDAETGMHYNYLRDYDPGIGRYVQSDVIGLRGGMNTYTYAGSSPLREWDFFALVNGEGNGFSTRYGNWCGENWSGGKQGAPIPANPAAPIDSVDQCCMIHDYCYSAYECYFDGCSVPGNVNEGKKYCDRDLIRCLDALKGKRPEVWPKPPPAGREVESYFFCQKAKKYFSMKSSP
jgi:RHS repeat-associated protein